MSQTSLFGVKNEIKDNKNLLPNKIKWSYSKRSTLDSCLRRYFYYYYEAKKSPEIKSFKRLSSKDAVIGNIIHWIIACSLRNAQKEKEWDQERIISFGQKMVNDSIHISEQFESHAKFSGSENIFMEIVFGEANPDDLREEAFDKIDVCIENLFDSSEFHKIYEAGKLEYSLVESSTHFKLNDFITIQGQLDIAYFDGPGMRIVDWKTGEDTMEDSSLQLAIYALWASKKHRLQPEKIEISKAYLYADTHDSLVFNSIELERANARIIQDAYRMNELEEFAKTGQIDAFDMCESKNVCAKCSFKKVCYEK